jgi:phosphopantothenoylcysteine decarboxylase / phosphopantothenate---cysteine ligase
MLKGKNILLGITGSIAAYKAAILVRLLIKEGANVKVVMTKLAKEFITPLTLATLSKNPILVDFFNPEDGKWNSHVDLGLWANAYVIAPATANTMGKMANGVADNLLITSYLSARCPVFVAPAMDLDMFQHPSTQKNIEILASYGNHILEPTAGELASGLEGKGRMDEPENIVNYLINYFEKKKSREFKISGKRVLITAGPTHELIDPVRFIGNYSSGKMGYAIAEEASRRGAEVELVSGPVNLPEPSESLSLKKVTSASEMYNTSRELYSKCDVAIFSAAVADFSPVNKVDEKIKEKEELKLELKPTIDIAKELGKAKSAEQINVGFALETSNEKVNALEKLNKKNFDFIVLNSLRDSGAGFQHDTNKISIIDKYNNIDNFELKSKVEVAKDILDKIEGLLS